MGAIYELTQEENFRQYGALTPAEAAAAYQEIFDAGFYGVANCEIAPTPYWEEESGDDSDDEGSQLNEIWYGLWDGANIVDTLAGFVFTGFVAATYGTEGAIQFATFLIRLRLFFRTADVGAIVAVFVNGDHIFDVDTYSAVEGKKAVDLYMPASMGLMALSDEVNTFTLVNTGTANPLATPNADGEFRMAIIRKQISEGEIQPVNIIYDPDCDCVKKDWGDGLGFVDYPQGDPRHSTVFLRPARTDEDVRCASAANMVQWIHDFIDSAISTMEAFGFLLSVVTLIFNDLSLISEGFSLFISGVTELAGNLLTAGSVLIDASFTSTEYDALLCIFYCNIGGDGSVTPDQLTTIEGQVTDGLNTTAALIVNEILLLQGEVGLANAGRIGSATADCSDCDCGWCFTLDFTLTDGSEWGWTVPGGGTGGTWVSGTGWVGTFSDSNSVSRLALDQVIGIDVLTSYAFTYTKTDGGGANNVNHQRIYGAAGITLFADNTNTFGTDLTKTITGDFEGVTELDISMNSGTNSATIIVSQVVYKGLGTNPFGTSNC